MRRLGGRRWRTVANSLAESEQHETPICDRRDNLTSAESASALWERLGRAVRDRRLELQLTQRGLADKAGVSTQTVHRVEGGRPSSRHTSSWSKLEVALDWPRGFFEEFIAGKVAGVPRHEPGTPYVRVPVSVTTEFIHDLVEGVLITAAPDTPISRVREAQRKADEIFRAAGLLPPEEPQDTDGSD